MNKAEKQEIREQIKILENMIKKAEKEEIIKKQREKVDKLLEKYLKDL